MCCATDDDHDAFVHGFAALRGLAGEQRQQADTELEEESRHATTTPPLTAKIHRGLPE
jgi:hypothetical protein